MIARLSRLFRMPLSLMNGIAAVGGYSLFTGHRSSAGMLPAFIGVTLLAMGGAALNQVMERDIDALMTRTRQRPLPRNEMTPTVATGIGGAVILAGCAVLFSSGGLLPPVLGLAALVWYLAVYTPLKLRTSLALLPGALCGAVPPLVGWCLAGGAPADFRIIILAGLLFIWQIPHFWLLQKRYAADYRCAGIPLPTIKPGLFALWILALAATAMMLPAFGIVLKGAAWWYGLSAVALLVMAFGQSEQRSFSCLNFFPALITLTLLIQR